MGARWYFFTGGIFLFSSPCKEGICSIWFGQIWSIPGGVSWSDPASNLNNDWFRTMGFDPCLVLELGPGIGPNEATWGPMELYAVP